jgi:molecular chaperone GrpE
MIVDGKEAGGPVDEATAETTHPASAEAGTEAGTGAGTEAANQASNEAGSGPAASQAHGHEPSDHGGAGSPEAAPEQSGVDDTRAALEQRIDDLTRALAEQANIRSRLQRENEDRVAQAVKRFAADLVGVADNLGRALSAAPIERDEVTAAFVTGVEMTGKVLEATFERHGLRRVPGVGSPFDPMVHQAVARIPSSVVAANNVLMVHQEGWMLNGKLLREATVVISTGPAAAAPPPANDAGAGDDSAAEGDPSAPEGDRPN